MSKRGLSLPAWIGLLVGGAIMIAPLIWTLLLSFKSSAELMRDSASAFSTPYTLDNYRAIVAGSLVPRWLLNSTIVALGQTAGVLILCSLAGYGFSRFEFPFRRTLFAFVVVGLAIPEQAVILPRHQLFAMLHLHNSFPGLILPGLVAPFGVLFMTQYFRAIPRDLDEAALLDGSTRLQLFWKILLPLTIPAQATLGVFTVLGAWNDYWWPLISVTTSDRYTLTVGLASSQMNFAQTSGLGFLMAQAVFASIPILLVYILFQKQIVRAMAGTAVR